MDLVNDRLQPLDLLILLADRIQVVVAVTLKLRLQILDVLLEGVGLGSRH